MLCRPLWFWVFLLLLFSGCLYYTLNICSDILRSCVPHQTCVLLEEMKNRFDLDGLGQTLLFCQISQNTWSQIYANFYVFLCSMQENRQSLIWHEAADKNLIHQGVWTYLKWQNRSNLDWHFVSFSHTIFDLSPEAKQTV